MNKLLFVLFPLLAFLQATGQDNFPTGQGNRDATKVMSVISREVNYPVYYDKVFYQSSAGNSPSFTFPDYGTISYGLGSCVIGTKRMQWWCEYEVDYGTSRSSYTINPEVESGTRTVIVQARNYKKSSCTGAGETSVLTVCILTVKFERPEWTGIDEIKTICNSVDKDYNLKDYFTVTDNVTFYLDNSPITVLNPKNLAAGFHKLEARKTYDNGIADFTYGSKRGEVAFPFEFQVLQGTTITLDNYPSAVCQDAPVFNIKATPSGGTWDGRGIDAAGNVTPASMATGRNVFTYKITNDVGCTSQKEAEIFANQPPTVTVEDLDVCRQGDPFTLSMAQPAGGVYTWRGGIPITSFNPATALVGNNLIKYRYTDPVTGCATEEEFNINVVDAGSFTVGDDMNSCTGSGEINLNTRNNVNPSDGSITWAGEGVISQKYFSPVAAGVGLHQITGTLYKPESGCTYTKSFTVKVITGPTVDAGADVVVCQSGGDYYIPPGQPVGGVWSGPYVDNGYFRAASAPVGAYAITLTYTDPSSGCTGTDTKVIQCVAAPVLNVGNDLTVCAGSKPFAPPVPSVPGGSWAPFAGDFYDPANNLIDPAKMQQGENKLIYTVVTAAGCTISATLTITLNPGPAVTAMRDFTACINGTNIILVATPTNGIWEGPGIDNNAGSFFVPSDAGSGSHLLTYTYTDQATGCTATATTIATVNPLPALKMPGDSVICVSSGTLVLHATPDGGSWSGSDGLAGATFNPAIAGAGSHQLSYTITEAATRCSNTGTVNYTVKGLPGSVQLSGDTTACKGKAVDLVASADNAGSFNWYKDGDTLPFLTGPVLHYTITHDEVLQVKPIPVQTGDCPGNIRSVQLVNNSPTGTVERASLSDTIAYGGLFTAIANLENVTAYHWDFDDGEYSFDSAGAHYYYQPGAHTITLEATGRRGCVTSFTLPVVYVLTENGQLPDPEFSRGDGQDPASNSLLVYPTAFDQDVTVEFSLKVAQDITLILFDFRGVKVREIKQAATSGNNRIHIGTADLPGKGVWYFLRVQNKEFHETQKIFKL